MICGKCGQDIPDKAFRLHQALCKGNILAQPAAATAAVIVPVGATAEAKLEQMPGLSQAMPPVTSEVVSHDSAVTDTHTEASKPPAPTVNAAQPQLTGQNGTEIFFPETDPNFIVPEFIADALTDTENISKKHPTNLLITGQPGGGKTSLALQYAGKWRRPAVVADFGVVQEPQQLFQTTHLIENEHGLQVTETRESAFIRGIETERCVVIMDELTRVENERCLNPLMPLLDGRKSTWIDELHRRIHVADGVVFIATINEGSMFAGVSSLDAALRDRFREVFMDYLPAAQESQILQSKCKVEKLIANSLAEFAYAVRHTPGISRKVSTRQLIHAAEAVSVGATLWRAVETAIGNYNDATWRQQVMEIFSVNIKEPSEYQKWVNKPRIPKYVEYK